jgi:hypothetical protein
VRDVARFEGIHAPMGDLTENRCGGDVGACVPSGDAGANGDPSEPA